MIDTPAISISPDMFILEVVDPPEIVVINLDRRPDRWAAMQESWHPEVAKRFVRFSATDGRLLAPHDVEPHQTANKLNVEKAAAEVACRQSWIRAVEEFGPALYFEDDARPGDLWPYGLPPDDATLVLLGGFLWRKTRRPGWCPAWYGASGAHAVWLRTDRAAKSLVRAWQSDDRRFEPIDISWSTALIRSRAVIAVPQMVLQVDLGTDIQIGRTFHRGESSPFDPWCSLEGGLQQVRRSNSWIHYGYDDPEIVSRAPSK
ncbi:MAG: hypothetical protein AB7G88_08245 [Thermomicrobiales bacterium]